MENNFCGINGDPELSRDLFVGEFSVYAQYENFTVFLGHRVDSASHVLDLNLFYKSVSGFVGKGRLKIGNVKVDYHRFLRGGAKIFEEKVLRDGSEPCEKLTLSVVLAEGDVSLIEGFLCQVFGGFGISAELVEEQIYPAIMITVYSLKFDVRSVHINHLSALKPYRKSKRLQKAFSFLSEWFQKVNTGIDEKVTHFLKKSKIFFLLGTAFCNYMISYLWF